MLYLYPNTAIDHVEITLHSQMNPRFAMWHDVPADIEAESHSQWVETLDSVDELEEFFFGMYSEFGGWSDAETTYWHDAPVLVLSDGRRTAMTFDDDIQYVGPCGPADRQESKSSVWDEELPF